MFNIIKRIAGISVGTFMILWALSHGIIGGLLDPIGILFIVFGIFAIRYGFKKTK